MRRAPCASLRFNDLVTRAAPKGRVSWLPFRTSTYSVYWGNSAGRAECLGPLPSIVRIDKCDVRIGTIRRTFHRWTHSSLSRILQAHHLFLPRSNSTALLNLFFYRVPFGLPLFLSRDLPTFQRCGSCVDCCQMFRLSDLSSAHSLAK